MITLSTYILTLVEFGFDIFSVTTGCFFESPFGYA